MDKLKFDTYHFQFYICDEGSPMETDDLEFWSDEAMEDKMALNEGVIGVGIDSDVAVICEIESCTDEPPVQVNGFEHISEGVIDIKSGYLQILNCPDCSVEYEKKLTPGLYRFRILHIGLSEENEHICRVEYWADTNTEKQILKRQE